MSQTYMSRHQIQSSSKAKRAPRPAASGPSLDALKRGAMPSQEQMGHRVDLPAAIRARMESSFGMDFSGVQLYESQTVADAGARAVAMGNKISFAPGRLDLSSKDGQEILGHELSHVASQARGEVRGRGFLSDHALEARASREGVMAAAGKTVYTGPVTPISATSTALSAAGPMQAAKDKKKKAAKENMSQATSTLSPFLKESVQNASSSNQEDYIDYENRLLKPTIGNRWAYMRSNNNAGMRGYMDALHTSNQGVVEKVRAGKYRDLQHLQNVDRYGLLLSGEENRGVVATKNETALAYQTRALQNIREYLAAISEDEAAMHALRESANMYSSLGTYGQRNADGTLNKTGMNNGREEALNRAMNDMLLRGYTPDSTAMPREYFAAEPGEEQEKVLNGLRSQLGSDLTGEDLQKARVVDMALLKMQSKVMNRSITGNTDEMTEQEMELRNMLNEFYIANGLMGQKTSSDSSHIDDAEQRAMMLELERKIKHPDPNEDPKERQARIRMYMILKNGRVDWDSSREYR